MISFFNLVVVQAIFLRITFAQCEGLGVSRRPSLTSMSQQAGADFETAILALKVNGEYDRFVDIHRANPGTAHGGSNFLVWHRDFLWEFDLALDAVFPGVRIPFYDWSSTGSPLMNDIWGADMMGSCNVGGSGGIVDGPFSGMDAQLTRAGNANRDIPTSGFIAEGLSVQLDYASFNNWLEIIHSSFHVAVGGSMNDLQNSPKDPIFDSHHAFIDSVYADWQRRGGGDEFSGTHGGGEVSDQTVMQPFGRTAGGILSGISRCVRYECSVGGAVSRQAGSEQAIFSGGNGSGGKSSIIPTMTKEQKESLQLVVARKKATNPALYQAEAAYAVQKKDAIKDGREQVGSFRGEDCSIRAHSGPH